MLKQLAELTPNSMLTIDQKSSSNFTGLDDFKVVAVEEFALDNGDVVIVDCGDYCLIATDISGEPQYSICEIYDDTDDYLDTDGDFIEEIEIQGGEDSALYELVEPAYASSLGDDSFCEYTSSDNEFDYMLIQTNQDFTQVFRGIILDENNIII